MLLNESAMCGHEITARTTKNDFEESQDSKLKVCMELGVEINQASASCPATWNLPNLCIIFSRVLESKSRNRQNAYKNSNT